MNRQNKMLAYARTFSLWQRRKGDRMWYEVKCNVYTLKGGSMSGMSDVDAWAVNMESVRDFFDPLRNKSGERGLQWKYSNRKDAEQMYITATLRWA